MVKIVEDKSLDVIIQITHIRWSSIGYSWHFAAVGPLGRWWPIVGIMQTMATKRHRWKSVDTPLATPASYWLPTIIHRLHLPPAAFQLLARHVNVKPTVAALAAAGSKADGGVLSGYFFVKKDSTLIQSCYVMLGLHQKSIWYP